MNRGIVIFLLAAALGSGCSQRVSTEHTGSENLKQAMESVAWGFESLGRSAYMIAEISDRQLRMKMALKLVETTKEMAKDMRGQNR